MQNDEGVSVELFIPRKCSATNRIITSRDHASVQINVGLVDANGHFTGETSAFALCGSIRSEARADAAVNRLAHKKGLLSEQFAN